MERRYIEQYTDGCNLHGIYRGEVVYTDDPKRKGRVKLFVYGVYSYELKNSPEQLPWAEPAMSLFGGNWTNQNFKRMTEAEKETLKKAGMGYDYDKDTYFGDKNYDTSKEVGLNQETGWCSIPHANIKQKIGAQVFCFFEGGDANRPVYFAAAQSGDGWISEYPNQHSIKTDNVSVIINEDYEGLDQKAEITENQVSTTQNTISNSAVFNEYANKKAMDFIPEVDFNDEFDQFDSDSNGIVENSSSTPSDGNNFGNYSTKSSAEERKEIDNTKEAVSKSKPDGLSHTVTPSEEIKFYDEIVMPTVTFNFDYTPPSNLSYEDILFFELRISNDSEFKSILKYKVRKEDKTLKINSLHVGKFYIKVQAVFAEYGRSDWSSVDTVEIKYKEKVKLKYEPQKTTRPTRVNVFIENRKGVAINLRILGDVNMNIDGNVTEIITGDKYQQINGSLVQTIKKGLLQTVEGVACIINKDDYTQVCDKERSLTVKGDNFEIYQKDSDIDIYGGLRYNVMESTIFSSLNNIKLETYGSFDVDCCDIVFAVANAFSVDALGGIGFETSTFQCNCSTNIELAAMMTITVGCNIFRGNITTATYLNTALMLTTVTGNRTDVTGGNFVVQTTGNATINTTGILTVTTQGNQNIAVGGVSTITIAGTSSFSVDGVSVFDASMHYMYPTSPHIHISSLPGHPSSPPLF